MRLEGLLEELEGISSGDPQYVHAMTPQDMREKAIAIISSIFQSIGFEDITTKVKEKKFVFDMCIKLEDIKIAVDLKFGEINNDDINRYKIMTNVSSSKISKLFILCSNVPREIELEMDDIKIYSPIQVLTFTQLINILNRPRGEGILIIQDLVKSSPSRVSDEGELFSWEDHVKDYITSTLGDDVFKEISKSEMSLSVFSQNREFLGKRPARIILTGTTNTGKSTIGNRLFGEKIVDTAPYTDHTGEIAKFVLSNGVEVYDTPGVGGINDKFENVTRAFLGIGQSEDLEMAEEIPFTDLSLPNKPEKFNLTRPIIDNDDCVIIFVFDLIGGLKRADFEFYRLIKKRIPRVIIVGNRQDLLRDEDDLIKIKKNIQEKIGWDFVSISAGPKDGEPVGMENLVQKICYILSDNTVISFNEELINRYRREYEDFIYQTIERFSSRAAVIKPFETIPGSSLPVYQALMIGLLMRLGIDYKVGGNETRDLIIEATKNIFIHVSSQSFEREMNVREKEKKEEKWFDTASEGGIVGTGTGAVIGSIGGPLGALIGALLGGLIGGAIGGRRKIKRFITKLWTVPVESIKEVPGGSEATIVIMSYGFSLWKTFEKFKESGMKDFDMEFFNNELNNYHKKFKSILSEEDKKILDQTKNEEHAREIIHRAMKNV